MTNQPIDPYLGALAGATIGVITGGVFLGSIGAIIGAVIGGIFGILKAKVINARLKPTETKSSITKEWAIETVKSCQGEEDMPLQASRPSGEPKE